MLAIFATDAAAVTVSPVEPRPWTRPGTNPCRDLCGARWALDRMRDVMPAEVHAELSRRIDAGDPRTDDAVATGDQIRAMSYARDGAPFVDFARRVAQFPQGVEYPARGHMVEHDGVLYRFVRVAACGNWALIVGPGGNAALAVLSWLAPDRPILLGDLGDVIVGGAGDDSLAQLVEDLPATGGGAPPRAASRPFFATRGNGPVVRYAPSFGGLSFGPSFGSSFGSSSGAGGFRGSAVGRRVVPAAGPFGLAALGVASPLPRSIIPPAASPLFPEPEEPAPRRSGSPGPTGTPGTPGTPGQPHDPDAPPSPPPPLPWPPEHERARTSEPPPAAIPLPGTLALIFAGIAVLGSLRLRRS